MHYVIIGCGAAGMKAASTIRENDPQAEISLVSSDLWPLYLKPVLADYIAGRIDISRMAHMSTSKLEQLNVTLHAGKRVSGISTKENRILFSDGSDLGYQFLLIATGAKPAVPAEFQRFAGSYNVLNTLSDAVRIKEQAEKSKKAVVIGNGRPAVELLRALHSHKFELSLFTDEVNFWPAGDPVDRDDVLHLLKDNGITVHWSSKINDIIDLDGENYRISNSDGTVLDTHMILSAPNLVPNMAFVKGSPLKTDRGILVSEDLRTNIPNVFACGDVAQVYDLNKGVNRINFGWTSASKQGEIAGLNMIGRDTVFIPAHEEYFLLLYGEKLLSRW